MKGLFLSLMLTDTCMLHCITELIVILSDILPLLLPGLSALDQVKSSNIFLHLRVTLVLPYNRTASYTIQYYEHQGKIASRCSCAESIATVIQKRPGARQRDLTGYSCIARIWMPVL